MCKVCGEEERETHSSLSMADMLLWVCVCGVRKCTDQVQVRNRERIDQKVRSSGTKGSGDGGAEAGDARAAERDVEKKSKRLSLSVRGWKRQGGRDTRSARGQALLLPRHSCSALTRPKCTNTVRRCSLQVAAAGHFICASRVIASSSSRQTGEARQLCIFAVDESITLVR